MWCQLDQEPGIFNHVKRVKEFDWQSIYPCMTRISDHMFPLCHALCMSSRGHQIGAQMYKDNPFLQYTHKTLWYVNIKYRNFCTRAYAGSSQKSSCGPHMTHKDSSSLLLVQDPLDHQLQQLYTIFNRPRQQPQKCAVGHRLFNHVKESRVVLLAMLDLMVIGYSKKTMKKMYPLPEPQKNIQGPLAQTWFVMKRNQNQSCSWTVFAFITTFSWFPWNSHYGPMVNT